MSSFSRDYPHQVSSNRSSIYHVCDEQPQQYSYYQQQQYQKHHYHQQLPQQHYCHRHQSQWYESYRSRSCSTKQALASSSFSSYHYNYDSHQHEIREKLPRPLHAASGETGYHSSDGSIKQQQQPPFSTNRKSKVAPARRDTQKKELQILQVHSSSCCLMKAAEQNVHGDFTTKVDESLVLFVLETLGHLLSPFLSSVDILQMGAVTSSLTNPYRGMIKVLRIARRPPSHYFNLLNLLSNLKSLQSLQVNRGPYSMFALIKCFQYSILDHLSCLELCNFKLLHRDRSSLFRFLAQGPCLSLVKLRLHNCGLTDEGLRHLVGVLRQGKLKYLEELHVGGGNSSIRESLLVLGQVLAGGGESCPNMRVLHLGGSHSVGQKGIEYLLRGLMEGWSSSHQQLTGVVGVVAASPPRRSVLLRGLERFEELNLVECNLLEDGTETLARSLRDDPLAHHLQRLVLSSNCLQDGGLTLLSTAFVEGACPQLSELHLEDNHISDRGLGALIEACQRGPCLQELQRLNLSCNLLTAEGVGDLVGMLQDTTRQRSTTGNNGGGGGTAAAGCRLYLYGKKKKKKEENLGRVLPRLNYLNVKRNQVHHDEVHQLAQRRVPFLRVDI